MKKYLEQTNKEEVKLWINSVLKNYLAKKEENQGEIEHIIDYLNSEEAPKRLLKMSYSQANNNVKKWTAKLNKEAEKILEAPSDIKVIKKYKNYFKIVQLIGKNAYAREGLLMKHCVGSYYDKKDHTVYSLRDKENMPHCTFEIISNSNQVNQVKGKGNGSIQPLYISYVLDFFKSINFTVRDSEMENLGYYKIDKKLKKLIENNFPNASFFKKEWLFLAGKKLKAKEL